MKAGKRPISIKWARRLFLVAVFCIFAGELAIMLALGAVPGYSRWELALLDPILLSIAVLPILYWCVLRPLIIEARQREEAEQRLAEQNLFLNNVLESLTHPFYVIDARDYTIKIANSAARLGELGPHATCYELTHHRQAPCHEGGETCPVDEVVASGRPAVVEHVHYDRENNARVCEVHAYPIRDASGKVVQIIEYSLDVTARKRAEQGLQQAKQAAEEANRAKDRFLAMLSHELRTPLTPVLAALSLLEQDAELPRPYAEDVEMIRRNVVLEARLIDDLLDVTRIARGKVELNRRLVELREVLRHAVEVCQPDIEARALHLGMDLDECSSCTVYADAARLQQVFWNLLKNAIKFTPHGGCVAIRCRCDGHGYVVVEVKDTGVGIEPAALPHVFNAFEQGSAGITRQFGGLGLGLTITKGLVEMHGGCISVESEGKDKGTTCRIRLPLHETVELSAPSGWKQPAKPWVARALRILVVEDHGDTVRILRRLLAGDGHEVQTAGDVSTALDLARSQHFDLLVSDLGLPDRSGLDLMRTLQDRGQGLLGIALTGYGQEEDVRQSRAAGFVEHLTKPVEAHRLREAIRRVMAVESSTT